MSESPRVLEIQIAEDKGQPMKPLTQATIVAAGIEGDRYAAGKGAFSKSPPPRNIDRHITLIETEAIQAVNTERNIAITFADTRRNILTIGIPLNDLVGKQFYIGEVLVEGVELCDPCGRPGTLAGRDEVRQHFKEAFENRGGLRVRVLGTGTISTGDEIRTTDLQS
jgi:MOSC domain-containing protein YiiM